MTSSRNRFVSYFKGGPQVRPPFMNVFGPMRETVQRWREQGMQDDTQCRYVKELYVLLASAARVQNH